MNLESTIQYMFDRYPMLFQTRKQALDHLFCTIGNGYDWLDGELVAHDDDPNYVATLSAEGKAQPRQDIIQEKVQEEYKELLKRNFESRKALDPAAKALEKGEITQEQYESLVKIFDRSYPIEEEALMKQARSYVDGSFLRDGKDTSMVFYPLSEYSKIFNVPKDVKPDWLEGVKETVKLLLAAQQLPGYDYGFGENPNEWQKSEQSKYTAKLHELAKELGII